MIEPSARRTSAKHGQVCGQSGPIRGAHNQIAICSRYACAWFGMRAASIESNSVFDDDQDVERHTSRCAAAAADVSDAGGCNKSPDTATLNNSTRLRYCLPMKLLCVLITDRQTNSMPPAITVESRDRQEHTHQWRTGTGFAGVRAITFTMSS